jgi:hypothetical protein
LSPKAFGRLELRTALPDDLDQAVLSSLLPCSPRLISSSSFAQTEAEATGFPADEKADRDTLQYRITRAGRD